MAGPELLCTQAAEALASGDRELFKKKLCHPRWDPFHKKMESVIKACLQQPDALELLQVLKSSGVRMGNRYQDLTVVGMATEALKPDVVEWLLDAGWPLPWGSYTIAPLGVLLEGFSRQIGQVKPEQRPEIQERACQVARLFYRNASAFGPLVGSQSVEFLARKFDTPGIEQIWKALAEEGWDVQNLDEDTQSFVDQLQRKHPEKFGSFDRSLGLARAWQRETALDAAMPAASVRGPKMRF
jgi:hypothetical protein